MTESLNRMETLIEVSRMPFRQAHQRLAEINQEHIEIAKALLKNEGELGRADDAALHADQRGASGNFVG